MNAIKKDANFSLTALAKAYGAAIAELGDVIEGAKAKVEAIAEAKELAKDARDAVSELDGKDSGDGRGLWGDFLIIGRTVDAMTADAENDKLTSAVLEAVIGEIADGENAKSVSSYASTIKTVTKAIREGRTNWNLITEKKYSEVRNFLKSDDAKELDAAKVAVKEVIARISKHKNKATATAMLHEITALLEDYAVRADASREDSKAAAKAAKELEALRQQHPSAPATLETVKVA